MPDAFLLMYREALCRLPSLPKPLAREKPRDQNTKRLRVRLRKSKHPEEEAQKWEDLANRLEALDQAWRLLGLSFRCPVFLHPDLMPRSPQDLPYAPDLLRQVILPAWKDGSKLVVNLAWPSSAIRDEACIPSLDITLRPNLEKSSPEAGYVWSAEVKRP